MVTDQRNAREREAMARAPRQHLEPAEGIDAASVGEGVEDARYMDPAVPAQWMVAYKLFLDEQGEYGIALPVPVGQWTNGANALVNMKRRDGGYAWTAIRPARMQPLGTLECIEETCGDAHLGGRRKMLRTISDMIAHVESFHPRAAKDYQKYLAQLADQQALDNPRLQRLMGANAPSGQSMDIAFYCDNDECARFFDTEQGRDQHARSHKREGAE